MGSPLVAQQFQVIQYVSAVSKVIVTGVLYCPRCTNFLLQDMAECMASLLVFLILIVNFESNSTLY